MILPLVPYQMALDELRAELRETRIREQAARELCVALLERRAEQARTIKALRVAALRRSEANA